MNIKYLEASNHAGGYVKITAVVDADIQYVAKLVEKTKQKPFEMVIKPVTKKRSLDANALYQAVLDLVASALSTSRDEVHEMMLIRYGVTKTDADGDPIVFPTRLGKDGHSVARYCEAIREGQLNGKPCMWWRMVKGSSEMNTEEFSHLLDGLLSEAKELDIHIPDSEYSA